ncbi:hypothetical protein [Oricola cellulosilytica]|uniref:Response regulatory domain-containing protein n=1 Tax=Oricola cellulosilytica TaxID=1429082 RepID=A0A4R0PCS2_9HYPH|nr:hypothetical protein [Oricola cellulosilytica]TCD15086.1 hypothetical protein E0D97_05935 [Oricola cellulosilytica]
MLNGRNVLIVEDNALISLELESMALDLNAGTVVSARSGGDNKLPFPDQLSLGLAILDLRSLAKVSARLYDYLLHNRIPTVFLTTESIIENAASARNPSATISKPFSTEDLTTAVAIVIG